MDLTAVKQFATSTMGRSGLVVRKHSPAILTAVGVVGVIATTVMASKATLKLEETVENIQNDLELAKTVGDEQDQLKAKTAAYTVGTINIIKLYGPTVTLGVASIGCLIGAQGIMHRRNVALAAAYKAVEQGFSEYRKRVVDAFGIEQDREFRHGKTELVQTKDEEGNEVEVEYLNPNGISVYARFFDETCPNWEKNAEYNRLFIQSQQNYWNDVLRAKGHVFLNEVYDALGLERSQAGAVVGWVMGRDGDNFIDFGVFDGNNQMIREFINGNERSVLLDFNVDGVIYDKI